MVKDDYVTLVRCKLFASHALASVQLLRPHIASVGEGPLRANQLEAKRLPQHAKRAQTLTLPRSKTIR